uniref:hypothetical chloroplast RF1 n=1 Tax=Streptofilum capillatum TaxID=2058781 RepID=UPI00286C6B7B|nr:hypothetical chloroplast RF1 [Streptofilum capillatum]WKT08505.1 hypothetical chloroplast RF1 [Streptofilum capillatum]
MQSLPISLLPMQSTSLVRPTIAISFGFGNLCGILSVLTVNIPMIIYMRAFLVNGDLAGLVAVGAGFLAQCLCTFFLTFGITGIVYPTWRIFSLTWALSQSLLVYFIVRRAQIKTLAELEVSSIYHPEIKALSFFCFFFSLSNVWTFNSYLTRATSSLMLPGRSSFFVGNVVGLLLGNLLLIGFIKLVQQLVRYQFSLDNGKILPFVVRRFHYVSIAALASIFWINLFNRYYRAIYEPIALSPTAQAVVLPNSSFGNVPRNNKINAHKIQAKDQPIAFPVVSPIYSPLSNILPIELQNQPFSISANNAMWDHPKAKQALSELNRPESLTLAKLDHQKTFQNFNQNVIGITTGVKPENIIDKLLSFNKQDEYKNAQRNRMVLFEPVRKELQDKLISNQKLIVIRHKNSPKFSEIKSFHGGGFGLLYQPSYSRLKPLLSLPLQKFIKSLAKQQLKIDLKDINQMDWFFITCNSFQDWIKDIITTPVQTAKDISTTVKTKETLLKDVPECLIDAIVDLDLNNLKKSYELLKGKDFLFKHFLLKDFAGNQSVTSVDDLWSLRNAQEQEEIEKGKREIEKEREHLRNVTKHYHLSKSSNLKNLRDSKRFIRQQGKTTWSDLRYALHYAYRHTTEPFYRSFDFPLFGNFLIVQKDKLVTDSEGNSQRESVVSQASKRILEDKSIYRELQRKYIQLLVDSIYFPDFVSDFSKRNSPRDWTKTRFIESLQSSRLWIIQPKTTLHFTERFAYEAEARVHSGGAWEKDCLDVF